MVVRAVVLAAGPPEVAEALPGGLDREFGGWTVVRFDRRPKSQWAARGGETERQAVQGRRCQNNGGRKAMDRGVGKGNVAWVRRGGGRRVGGSRGGLALASSDIAWAFLKL